MHAHPHRAKLPDHASHEDDRGVPIDRVGIRGLAYPITCWDREQKLQHTVATIDATVALLGSVKGTHMSRFVEVLNRVRGELSLKNLPEVVAEIGRRLESEHVQLDVRFPYFVERRAPVSRARGLVEYRAAFLSRLDAGRFDFVLEVGVPVTTLCPCSKAVSDRGAHNQRSWVTVRTRAREFLWIEDVVEAVEGCASSPLYSLLKREDEKFVTERAYDHPRFVEDLIREVTLALRDRCTWMHVSVENLESIHNHSAWAELTWSGTSADSPRSPPRRDRRPRVPSPPTPGAWLRGARVGRHWSQARLAEEIGVSASLLSRAEGDARRLPDAAIARLAVVLGEDVGAVRLRLGIVDAAILERVRGDPGGFLGWVGK
jgi:GTP cyclohydrolase I